MAAICDKCGKLIEADDNAWITAPIQVGDFDIYGAVICSDCADAEMPVCNHNNFSQQWNPMRGFGNLSVDFGYFERLFKPL